MPEGMYSMPFTLWDINPGKSGIFSDDIMKIGILSKSLKWSIYGAFARIKTKGECDFSPSMYHF